MTAEVVLRAARAGYGALEVLHGVDLTVPAATVVGLLGPNGAGKTTLLRLVAGIVPLRAGTLRWRGRDVAGMPADARARRGMLLVPASDAVWPHLTVAENLAVAARHGPPDPALAAFPVLADRLGQRASDLSGGEQRMLALSRALLAAPRLLLVDELSLGLAPRVSAELFATVARMARAGTAVVLADQNVGQVLDIASVAYQLRRGEVSFAGEPAELRGGRQGV